MLDPKKIKKNNAIALALVLVLVLVLALALAVVLVLVLLWCLVSSSLIIISVMDHSCGKLIGYLHYLFY